MAGFHSFTTASLHTRLLPYDTQMYNGRTGGRHHSMFSSGNRSQHRCAWPWQACWEHAAPASLPKPQHWRLRLATRWPSHCDCIFQTWCTGATPLKPLNPSSVWCRNKTDACLVDACLQVTAADAGEAAAPRAGGQQPGAARAAAPAAAGGRAPGGAAVGRRRRRRRQPADRPQRRQRRTRHGGGVGASADTSAPGGTALDALQCEGRAGAARWA
jgi:hypothetical protein